MLLLFGTPFQEQKTYNFFIIVKLKTFLLAIFVRGLLMKRFFAFIVSLFLTLSLFAQSIISRNVLDESSFVKGSANFIVYSAPEMSMNLGDNLDIYDNKGNPAYIVAIPHDNGYWVYSVDNTGFEPTVYEFSSYESAIKFIRTIFSLKYTIMEKVWWYYGDTEKFYSGYNINKEYKDALRNPRMSCTEEPKYFDILIDALSYMPYGFNKTTPGSIVMNEYNDALRKKAVKTSGSLITIPTAIVNNSILSYGINGAQFSKVPDNIDAESYSMHLIKEDALKALMEQPVVVLTKDNFKNDNGYFDYQYFIYCSRRSKIIYLCPNGLDSLIESERKWTGNDSLFPRWYDNDYIKSNLIEIWRY